MRISVRLLLALAVALAVGCGPKPDEQLSRGLSLADTDPAAAAAELGPACDAGLWEACAAAGALELSGDPRTAAWNEIACEHSLREACVRRSERPDDAFRVKACTLGHAESCAIAAGAAADPAQRRAWLAEACGGGHVPSCLPAGDAALAAGDAAAGARLYQRACDGAPTGEHGGGGEGPHRNEHSTACTLAARVASASPDGEIPWPDGDPAAVSEALWARCAADDAWGCLQLAEHVERGGGPLPAKSRGDAAWLRSQACDLQLQYACAPHRW